MTTQPELRKRKYFIVPTPEERSRTARFARQTHAQDAVARDRASAADLELRAWERFGRSRRELIADAAYFRAERRGFTGGHAVADWLEAQARIDELLERT